MARNPAVTIRATEASDAIALQRLYNERVVAAMTLQVPYQNATEIEARLAASTNTRRIVAEIDGKVVGDGGLTLYHRRQKHVGSIGMAVSEEYQGQGVGTAILTELLDLADNWYGLTRVELHVYVDNVAAIGLYERHGFIIEGHHREYAFRLGEIVDAYTMARLVLDLDDPIDDLMIEP